MKSFCALFVLPFLAAACAPSQRTVEAEKPIRTSENFMTNKVQKSEEEWRKELTPQQYYVLRQKGTERPGTGEYLHTNEKGVYRCAACGYELFTSDTKYDSHCGWPAFYAPAKPDAVAKQEDLSHGMERTEVMCPRCGGHLGHVFEDGPSDKGGLRYCINSLSLKFDKAENADKK
jgi:peptide-methionine (R)-S-oxide reductase